MSLIDEAASNLSPYKTMISEKAGQKDEQKFIIQPHILMDILNDEMSSRVIDKKVKKEFASYRTKLSDVSWRLAGTLNFVDEEIWRGQIDKTIESMLKHIKLRQPNGQWVVMEYESDIRTNKKGDDCIMLAVKFVDANNSKDLKYQNGVPLVDVQVDVTGSNAELIKAINAQKSNTDNTELIATLNKFIETVAANGTNNKTEQKSKQNDSSFDGQAADFVE